MMSSKKPGRQSGSVFIGLLVGMVVVYLLVMMLSLRGWGYMGYGGYHHGPSFMYWGGPSIYHSRNVRNGSVGGSNTGGGFSAGK